MTSWTAFFFAIAALAPWLGWLTQSRLGDAVTGGFAFGVSWGLFFILLGIWQLYNSEGKDNETQRKGYGHDIGSGGNSGPMGPPGHADNSTIINAGQFLREGARRAATEAAFETAWAAYQQRCRGVCQLSRDEYRYHHWDRQRQAKAGPSGPEVVWGSHIDGY